MKPRPALLSSLLLVVVTFGVFWPVRGHGFLGFDDGVYITENSEVRAGLSWDGAVWSFTSWEHARFWHPLTWLSLQLDAQLFGLQGELLGLPASGWHHLSNLTLHALCAVLLFLFLRRATGACWPSLFVAALFALHPLHVESVAWASQRKDTLSTAFGFGCLLAWARYVRDPSTARYLAALGLFALGLMAKPMLVTWPFVLLLFDLWPFGRWSREAARRLVLEKAPFLALALGASLLAYLAQGSATEVLDLSLGERLSNAVVSYAIYLGKTVWPTDLAVIYPHRQPGPAVVLGSVALLAVLTAGAVRVPRRHRYATVGWLFFLGTLVPVIGLVQVGLHARADRYTYVPLVGLFVAAAWGGAAWIESRPNMRRPLTAVAVLALVALAAVTRNQLRHWNDTVTLFRHTVAVTEENGWAHRILGTALADTGRSEEAVEHYRIALEHWPEDPIAHNNLGRSLGALGRSAEAIASYEMAVRFDPDEALYRANLGSALAREGRLDEAVSTLRAALELDPDSVAAHNHLGRALGMQGRMPEAAEHFSAVVRLDPNELAGWSNLAAAQAELGRFPQASVSVERARQLALRREDFALARDLEQRRARYEEGLP